ncbi:MAG TPA: ABC transporter ATP-binding protein [Roseiarcus sp.]|jgi:ABC-type dipeptide/oligopeptide/nickel transport system ATPase component
MPTASAPALGGDAAAAVLAVRNLCVTFQSLGGPVDALSNVALHVRRGEKVALVGESGSGKSTIARAVLGLLQNEGRVVVSGSAQLKSREILGDESAIRAARGDRVTMIFQDAVSALNPAFTIGDQFIEVLRRGDATLTNGEALRRARAALVDVYLHDPDRVLGSYVFQLSGGMSQRVMIALALVNNPDLLIADEPGSSLDVTVQARTLHLMNELIGRRGTSVLFISHNLGVVREFADRVYVIYRGRIVEHATAAQLFADPRHPYTRALMAAVPKLDVARIPDVPETSLSFADPLIEHDGCAEPSLAPA